MRTIFFLLFIPLFFQCKKENAEPVVPVEEVAEFYFPPINSDTWETIDPAELNWSTEELDDLYQFLENNGTRAFLLLKDGKLVFEKYWGKTILDNADFGVDSDWYWASAGKTMTAFLTGLAQEQGHLSINEKTSDYLGKGWTSLPQAKEDLITVWHQLTMTTGLDYTAGSLDCTDPECLKYRADAGTQWYYHNAPYTLLEKVVSEAAGIPYQDYMDQQLSPVGINGTWRRIGYNNVLFSTARDAARFGLLVLNEGKWEDQIIMEDTEYLRAMIQPSQELNPSYGYLWWLNGQSSIVMPSLPIAFNQSLAPSAPKDLVAAMGKNGQFVSVVPSEGLVMIRMGDAPVDFPVPTDLHNDIWAKIMGMIPES